MDSIVNFYRKATAFRHAHGTLVYGKFDMVDRNNPRVLAYTRGEKGKDAERFIVAINLTDKAAKVKLPKVSGAECALFTLAARKYEEDMRLMPFEAIVFRLG